MARLKGSGEMFGHSKFPSFFFFLLSPPWESTVSHSLRTLFDNKCMRLDSL